MKINNILLVIILLSMIGCKKDPQKITPKTSEIQQTQNISNSQKTNVEIDKSFVISCGSGCAMTYTAENILQNDDTSIKVKFKVEIHTGEQLSDSYYENYLFSYDKNKEIEKITIEGKLENILSNLMPDAQDSFREFATEIIQDKNIGFSQIKKENNTSNSPEYNICALPFDFDKYYSICNENIRECRNRYPSYSYPENKSILESFGIKDAPSNYFLLPKINNFQPIILAYTDSDIEGYYLKIVEKNKLISSLQIAKFDGETVEDFVITKDFEIELYNRKDATEKRILKRKYKILKDGFIK
ncbi:hypothetical protein [Chryseobacterium sp. T20]|uniref:hypothetical protein n=1 Tax=Chryseobacterium sp. T20 TaxID=3395375 RepID=UPI0039BCCB6E